MKPSRVLCMVLAVAGSSTAWAGEPGNLSLGGAAPATIGVYRDGGFSAGFLAATGSPPSDRQAGMRMGGYLAWDGGDDRPDDSGTSYGIRLGAAWSGEQFTVNPASRIGLTEVDRPGSDINLTFTLNHAVTPSLSLTGSAEAHHNTATGPDGGENLLRFGAGVGVRF